MQLTPQWNEGRSSISVLRTSEIECHSLTGVDRALILYHWLDFNDLMLAHGRYHQGHGYCTTKPPHNHIFVLSSNTLE